MGTIKELNIKNQTYYFLDDTIDTRNFHSNLVKIDKKPYENINIYYIGSLLLRSLMIVKIFVA